MVKSVTQYVALAQLIIILGSRQTSISQRYLCRGIFYDYFNLIIIVKRNENKNEMHHQISYTEIYNSYSPEIRRYLNSIFSIEDSEDLLQDIFLKVFNALPSFKGNSNIKTWIYRIATNTVLDRLKSNAYRFNKVQHELNPATFHYNNSRYSSTFDKQIEKEEMNDCIRQFINELTEKNRTVFVLSQYESLTNKEIAEILNITVDSVKIRLHRAKETLKAALSRNCSVYFDECSELACEPIITIKK